MFKNVATKVAIFAFDVTTGAPKTGDAANLTAYASKDYGTVTVLADTSATEMDSTNAKGWYLFDLAQGETNADALLFTGKSSTANVSLVGQMVFTTPANFSAASIDSNGRVDVIKIAGTTQTARDIGASVLLSSGTGTGQLDFTSGVVKANATQWVGGAIPAVNVTGVPLVDLKYTLGTISPATAGSVRADSVTGAVGSVTGLTASNLDTTISSRMATYAQPTGFLAATFPGAVASTTNITAGTITTVTNLTNAPTAGDLTATMKTSVQAAADAAITANSLVGAIAGYIDTEVAAIKAKTDNLPSDPADASDIAASFASIASTLSTIAGYLDTEVAAILAAVDTEVAAIKAKTDNLPASPAATGDAMALTSGERNSVADALLARNVAGGSSTGRLVKEALYVLRNKVAIAGGTQTVYGTDDSTAAFTAAVTTSAGDPIVSIDPS